MKVCPKCGYEKNEDDALFCNLCHEIFSKKKKEEAPLHLENLAPELKEKLISISTKTKTSLLPSRLFFAILILLLIFILGLIVWLIISFFTVLTLTFGGK